MNNISPLGIRRALGRNAWGLPQRFGPAGWRYDHATGDGRIIVTTADYPDQPGQEWIHASISRHDRMPTYEDLKLLHRAVYGDSWAYQVFAPADQHVNIHSYALHLFGRADGTPALPDFTAGLSTI